MFEFEQPAESLEEAANKCRTSHYWYIYGGNDYAGFDFDYVPVPWETDHIHVWPSQWQRDAGVYLANRRTVKQYQWHWRTEQSVKRLPDLDKWHIPTNIDRSRFDFSWHPDPHEPDYEYHFGTQWQSSGGPVYPGTAGVKLVDVQRAQAMSDRTYWHIPEEVKPELVDFSWHPNPLDPAYIYHFGTTYQQSVGLTYTVPGAQEIKFAGPIPGTENALETLDIFFIDYSNPEAQARYDKLKQQHPQIRKVRFANTLLDTIRRCLVHAKTGKFWIISSQYVYDQFDFAWHAEPWQTYMTHVFPSQWDKWSDTFLINRWEFERHAEWAKELKEFPNLNFVQDQFVRTGDDTFDIYYVDHGNPVNDLKSLRARYPNIKTTRFVDNYLDTFKRIVSTAETEYVWIVSSLCDYKPFDFTWRPEPWQAEMIHCFPSGTQKRGDTFYIHVPSFKTQMYDLELLDWFNVINYCDDQAVFRFETPIHRYSTDNLIEEIQNYNFQTPYVMFTNQVDLQVVDSPCLWTKKDRAVMRISASGATAFVPRNIKEDLRTQIYDYPYIETSKHIINDYIGPEKYSQLDIIYISNGEPDEQRWYDHACYMSNSEVKWIRGVNGRTAAYQAAARASDTPWFFTIFAKLEILGSAFDWFWMPDYFQEPKHYIFNARNPVNGLEYGHMGMIAYNKNLVLANNTPGIDFTLSQPHESVPILSGTARFNQDPWMTWRTAFREVLKLKHFMTTTPTVETEHRLHIWCTHAEGDFAEYCLAGAQDALRYYEEVQGNYELLKLSYDWAWLQERFNK